MLHLSQSDANVILKLSYNIIMNGLPVVKERIGYIDAMRGFTMLLVVYSHILYFGYGPLFMEHRTTFNDVFTIIYMPLFFFISGFVLYRKIFECSFVNLFSILMNKFKTLIIPTVFFSVVYLLLFGYAFVPTIVSETKGGYWFTIALFEFFIIYAGGNFFFQKLRLGEKWFDCFLILGALTAYVLSTPAFSVRFLGIDHDLVTALGITQWRFYLFFISGVLSRKYFVRFEKLLDNGRLMGLIIVSFFIVVLYYCHDGYEPTGPMYHLFFIFLGMSGIVVVFAFFRKYQSSFTKQPLVGRGFQSVGIRTLDIYLLHYFFLPRHLYLLGDYFSDNPVPVLEFFISSGLTAMVVLVCLVMSHVIRISDVLGWCLLGVKRPVSGSTVINS